MSSVHPEAAGPAAQDRQHGPGAGTAAAGVRARGAIWRWPIALAIVTAVGLLSALLGDAIWDALSWFALGAPVAVGAWFGWRRQAT